MLVRMFDPLQRVLVYGNDQAFKARTSDDFRILQNAACGEGISVMALVGAAGSVESALNWARENQPAEE